MCESPLISVQLNFMFGCKDDLQAKHYWQRRPPSLMVALLTKTTSKPDASTTVLRHRSLLSTHPALQAGVVGVPSNDRNSQVPSQLVKRTVRRVLKMMMTESTELLEPSWGSSFSCWAFKARLEGYSETRDGLRLGPTRCLKYKLGLGYGLHL